jgi:CDGSH-type Zn-finger protein
MDDTNQALANLLKEFDARHPAPAPEPSSGDKPAKAPPDATAREEETANTKEKALDRWFHEDRGGKRVPKRLDIPNEALVEAGGPLHLKGNITLINEEGHVRHVNRVALCRCGASGSKPLCDEQHLEIEFFDAGNIDRASDWAEVNRPQTVTVKAIKDGPLRFRGYLKIYNRKGQQFISTHGDLCRCGKSTKKPFCDCQ